MDAQLIQGNRILASLPPRELRRLAPRLEPVTLQFGSILYEPDGLIPYVYFPVDCLISLLTAVDARRTLEVGMVGREGMAGLPRIFGVPHSDGRALVQGGGQALRMAATPFLAEFERSTALRQALLHYAHALLVQVSQTAACNRFHDAGQRLARWLLMTADRLDRDEFALTQDFLAHMLGLRRVGVTVAATALRRRRLIEYARGHLRILDRKGLERACCPCYQRVQAACARAGD